MGDIDMIYAESAPNVSFYARLITSALVLPFNHHFPNTEFIKRAYEVNYQTSLLHFKGAPLLCVFEQDYIL